MLSSTKFCGRGFAYHFRGPHLIFIGLSCEVERKVNFDVERRAIETKGQKPHYVAGEGIRVVLFICDVLLSFLQG